VTKQANRFEDGLDTAAGRSEGRRAGSQGSQRRRRQRTSVQLARCIGTTRPSLE